VILGKGDGDAGGELRTKGVAVSVTPGARPAWTRWWPGGLAWALWVLTLLSLAATAWLDHLLRRASRPELVQLTAGDGVILVLASVSAAEGYARYGLLARLGTLPAASYLTMLASVTFIPGLGCIGFILLLTPPGKLPSPRWRRWAQIAAAAPAAFVVAWLLGVPAVDPESVLHGIGNPLAMPALETPLLVVAGVTAPLTALSLVVAGGSLVGRFRRARGVERQQLRWLSFPAALVLPAVLVMYAGPAS
jgi:hypothetical protein